MASSNDQIEIKIEKLCRTCLSKDDELNSLFDVIDGGVSLDFIVSTITGLKIRRGDGLPTTICCECRDKAAKAFDFKKKSEEAYNSLKGFYKDEKKLMFEYDDSNISQGSIDFKTEDSRLFSDQEEFSDVEYCLPLKNGPPEMNNIEIKVKVKHESSNREYFECKMCCLIFQSRAKYLEHKKTKCVKVEYEDSSGAHCPICGTSYDGANSLSNHMWQFHADLMGPKKRGRPKKAMTSTILSKLSENGFFIKTIHGKKIKCGFCKEQANTKEDLSVHMFEHSDVKILCCMRCKKMYLKKKNFNSHACVQDATKVVSSKAERENTSDRSNRKTSLSEMFLQELLDPDWEMNSAVVQVCSACSAVFMTEGDLTSHHDIEHPELSLRCNHCTKVFASVKTAARHRALCKDIERTYRCSTCGLKFAYEISLNKHILKYHQGESVSTAHKGKQPKTTENVQYQCDTCQKFFQRKEALVKHSKLHMPNQKLFECEICERKFNRSDNLRTHKRIHDADRPKPPTSKHLCLYCGRGFSNSSNLIVHMRRHTGEKPYKCDFCEKGFPRSSDLAVHRRSHTGEKPCVCGICGKAFSRSNKLSRHMRVHTGQRPYKCTYCDKAFSQSNDLTLHVRRHTGDRPYICDVCGDRFIQGTALQNHRRAHGHFSAPPPPALPNQAQAITYAVANITHHDDSHLSNTIPSI